jgi:hypothetical protein
VNYVKAVIGNVIIEVGVNGILGHGIMVGHWAGFVSQDKAVCHDTMDACILMLVSRVQQNRAVCCVTVDACILMIGSRVQQVGQFAASP